MKIYIFPAFFGQLRLRSLTVFAIVPSAQVSSPISRGRSKNFAARLVFAGRKKIYRTKGAHEPQSADWRSHQDQGQDRSLFAAGQGSERRDSEVTFGIRCGFRRGVEQKFSKKIASEVFKLRRLFSFLPFSFSVFCFF